MVNTVCMLLAIFRDTKKSRGTLRKSLYYSVPMSRRIVHKAAGQVLAIAVRQRCDFSVLPTLICSHALSHRASRDRDQTGAIICGRPRAGGRRVCRRDRGDGAGDGGGDRRCLASAPLIEQAGPTAPRKSRRHRPGGRSGSGISWTVIARQPGQGGRQYLRRRL